MWSSRFKSGAFLCRMFEASSVSKVLMKTKPFITNSIQSELSSHNKSGRRRASVVNQQNLSCSFVFSSTEFIHDIVGLTFILENKGHDEK